MGRAGVWGTETGHMEVFLSRSCMGLGLLFRLTSALPGFYGKFTFTDRSGTFALLCEVGVSLFVQAIPGVALAIHDFTQLTLTVNSSVSMLLVMVYCCFTQRRHYSWSLAHTHVLVFALFRRCNEVQVMAKLSFRKQVREIKDMVYKGWNVELTDFLLRQVSVKSVSQRPVPKLRYMNLAGRGSFAGACNQGVQPNREHLCVDEGKQTHCGDNLSH
ncbi:hypothetical protein BU25DRAFT_21956 [Macroventuria anomochaeta]|uniref:Uncharacterized protein n=1 Tax=Macroventuria anomochaeta TaxID=301207 RepID=A0ACB6S5C7_9PLEO|nr:uncharacterized protein BU25DRAFT_21956 [Macroventuria anomochaeta]KAF2629445.1 hypothetical protein BU25DRAFT_21956 [Macroventuria anomochaeta]